MWEHETIVYRVKGGWHAGVPKLNVTVRGDTERQARERLRKALAKAEELRNRPDPVTTSREE